MAKTAYLFDEIYLAHDTGYGHPERAERLVAINRKLKDAPYYTDLVLVKPGLPDIKYIEMIHDRSYIKRAKTEIEKGIRYLDSMDTAVCRRSFEVALYAVGGSLKMCDTIMNGEAKYGFCAIRPPGHHAERKYAAGFCIFNNIAIAAKYLQSQYGIEKIAIVDWDVHHGNGTQHSFEEDDTIFYISLHQYPHYPGTGQERERGIGKGKGMTLNIPMSAGSDNEIYIDAFEKRIILELEEFSPDIILISAGFDANYADQLSSIKLTSDIFHRFTVMLQQVADSCSDGQIIAFLEGGYNLGALSESVEMMMRAFIEN